MVQESPLQPPHGTGQPHEGPKDRVGTLNPLAPTRSRSCAPETMTPEQQTVPDAPKVKRAPKLVPGQPDQSTGEQSEILHRTFVLITATDLRIVQEHFAEGRPGLPLVSVHPPQTRTTGKAREYRKAIGNGLTCERSNANTENGELPVSVPPNASCTEPKWKWSRKSRRIRQRDTLHDSRHVLGQRSPATYRAYETAMRLYIKPSLGSRSLQALTPSDIEHFHATMQRERRLGESGLAPNTGRLNHAILGAALKVAVRDGLCHRNVAALATHRPAAMPVRQSGSWTAAEASRVLEEAKTLGPQAAALFALALDSGARRAELAGWRWADVDLTTGSLRI